MTIDLPEQSRAFLASQLETSHFADESAVVVYALDVWQQWEKYSVDVRAGVQQGRDDAAATRGRLLSTPDDVSTEAKDFVNTKMATERRRLKESHKNLSSGA